MIKHLLPPVTYYKANLHTHSTVSDGKLTPEEVCAAYKEAGYSILAITDHSVTVEHQHLTTDDFLLLTGVEIDVNDREGAVTENKGRERHFCLIGKDPKRQWIPYRDPHPIPSSVQYEARNEIGGLPRDYSPEGINAMIAECNRQGFFVIYNHPCWNLESYPDYAPMEGLWGMEYRNSGCIAIGYDENNSRIYQDFCMQGKRLMPVCADDTHSVFNRGNGYPVLGESWNMIGVKELTYEGVIEAMEKGDLYASCGPEITSLTWDEGKLRLTCSEAHRVQVLTQRRGAYMAFAKEDASLTEAEFDLSGWLKNSAGNENAFIRLIVTDKTGRYAVTRAYWMDELKG